MTPPVTAGPIVDAKTYNPLKVAGYIFLALALIGTDIALFAKHQPLAGGLTVAAEFSLTMLYFISKNLKFSVAGTAILALDVSLFLTGHPIAGGVCIGVEFVVGILGIFYKNRKSKEVGIDPESDEEIDAKEPPVLTDKDCESHFDRVSDYDGKPTKPNSPPPKDDKDMETGVDDDDIDPSEPQSYSASGHSEEDYT